MNIQKLFEPDPRSEQWWRHETSNIRHLFFLFFFFSSFFPVTPAIKCVYSIAGTEVGFSLGGDGL